MVVEVRRLEAIVRDLLGAIGENPDRDGLLGTPFRVARMYAEVFCGLDEDPIQMLGTQFDEAHQEMVILRETPIYSMCEHHLLPFFGIVHIGYIPQGKVVGLSKLARAADILARRPQLQERYTSQLADAIARALNPTGVAVVVEAQHLCMAMRGVQKPGSVMVTSATRGLFRDSPLTRGEFMSLVRGRS